MTTVAITLLGREGCHLCDVAQENVAGLIREFDNVTLEKKMVDEHASWLELYSDKVPVILVDGVEHGYWHIDVTALRAAIGEAGGLLATSDSE
jgi:glutaredoxin